MDRSDAGVIMIMFAALVLAFLVLLIAWLIEPEPLEVRSRHRGLDITELVTPGALTEQERRNSATSPDGSNIILEDGAWVQVAGEDGALAQQYSAQKIDPLPDGWMEMERSLRSAAYASHSSRVSVLPSGRASQASLTSSTMRKVVHTSGGIITLLGFVTTYSV